MRGGKTPLIPSARRLANTGDELTDSETTYKLSDTVYEEMLPLIQGGAWATNGRLPSEQDMAAQFRVSRPVIREALKRLRSEGLIQSRRGSGSFVVREIPPETEYPSISSIADLGPLASFREGVEGEAAALAAERRTQDQLDSLYRLVDMPRAAADEKNADRDFAFHVQVAEASANPFYRNTLLSLRRQMMLSMNLTWSLSLFEADFLDTVENQHRSVVVAIGNQNKDEACRLMRHHIRWVHNRFLHGHQGVLG